MTGLKYRNELKHIVTMADALVTRSRLSCMLRTDKNAGPNGGYHIRSLYFDTPEDKALFEKMEGLPIKEKFRIRFYNHNHGFIRLEKKVKHYSKTAKLSTTLTKGEVQDILGGSITFLKKSGQPLLREFYLKLRTERLEPKTIVDYMREAYHYPAGNVRVTMDSSVRTSISSTDLFDADLPNATALDSGLCILEVKYDGFLPEFIQDIVQLNNCTSTAFSKYAACRLYNTSIRGIM
ncbi:polyphosphate polymerase domain-containing protein [Desulfoscipio sp. XC116]|uniref:polyphosphate polymerase domain-containing protein n=1 Tax=Desulfoscipio sp. XC116 TaxID=3144975 RepID=UPI00325BA809